MNSRFTILNKLSLRGVNSENPEEANQKGVIMVFQMLVESL